MKTKSAKEMFDFIYKYNEMDLQEYIELLEKMIEESASFHNWVINHDNITYKNGLYVYENIQVKQDEN